MYKTRLLNVITNIVILIVLFKQLQNCNAALNSDECSERHAPEKTLGPFGGGQGSEKKYFCKKLGFTQSTFMKKNNDYELCLKKWTITSKTYWKQKKQLIRSKKDNTLSVDDYYNKICLQHNYNHIFWRKRHFLHIAKVAMDLDLDELKTFLSEANKLNNAGWGSDDLPNLSFSNWSFVDLKKAIKLQPYSVSPTSVDLIGRAIKSGFTYMDYDDFIKVTSTFEGFGEYHCRRNIFITAFKFSFRDVSIPPSAERFERNEEFWTKSRKTIFNNQLCLLLEMFHRNNNEDKTCMKFIEILQELKEELCKTPWDVNDITEIMTKSNNDKKTLLTMINCIKFSFELETRISQLNLLKHLGKHEVKSSRWQITDDYGSQFSKFRAILFSKEVEEMVQICDTNKLKYIENEISILNFMNTMLGENEDSLQKLFLKIR